MIAAGWLALTCAAAQLVLVVEAEPEGAEVGPPASRQAMVAHLSARETNEVELLLYALPPDPELLAGSAAAPEPSLAPRPPARGAVAAEARLRDALVNGAALLRSGLSAPAAALARAWLGWPQPLARQLPSVAPSPEPAGAPGGRLLSAWRVTTPEPGWNYADVALGPLAAGSYALLAREAKSEQRDPGPAPIAEVRFPVSSLGLLVARSGAAAIALAQDLTSGQARPGVELFAERGGHLQPLGRTGGDGTLALRAPLAGPWPRALLARQGAELARAPVPESPRGLSGPLGAVLLDRTVAQPGEAVAFWAMFRGVAGNDEGRLTMPDSARGEVALLDREARVVWRQAAPVSALGMLSGAIDLPLGLLPGAYTVAVTLGEVRRAADLRIAEPGPVQLSLECAREEGGPVCEARDALGRAAPGVAVRWRQERAAPGPSETLAEGVGVTDRNGRLPVPEGVPHPAQLRAEASDGAGHSATAEALIGPAEPQAWSLRPERSLLRPGHSENVELLAPSADGGRAHVRVSATAVRAGPGGDSSRTPLFNREVELDAHGRASLTVGPAAPGYLEISAEGTAGGRAHATVFVTEVGGDIPATPERLTLMAEGSEHRRGEELRLLLLTPFEAGAALLAFEPPVLPAQVVSIKGYSGVARLVLPTGTQPLSAVAAAVRGGRFFVDRLPLLRSGRLLPLTLRLAAERNPHSPARAGVSLEVSDEAGRPVATQASLLLTASAELPELADLLEPGVPAIGLATSPLISDSLPELSGAEPRNLQAYGPGQASNWGTWGPGALWTANVPESGRASLVALPAVARAQTLLALAAAGPDELSETRLHLPAGHPPRSRLEAAPNARPGDRVEVRASLDEAGCLWQLEGVESSHCDEAHGERRGVLSMPASAVELGLARGGNHPVERRSIHPWLSRRAPIGRPLARVIAEQLTGFSASGPAADLACAAVRVLGVAPVSSARGAELRGVLARLAQSENSAGGFGESSGELRRDLAAFRGLRGLGPRADPELTVRLTARLRRLLEGMDEEDPQGPATAAALRAFGRGAGHRPEDISEASAEELADWLSAARPSHAERGQAAARVRSLLGVADVLGLAELAVAANRLGLPVAPVDFAGPPQRQVQRMVPSQWTAEVLAADEELPEPRRVPLPGDVVTAAIGDELEVTLHLPITGMGFHCLSEPLPGGLAPEGWASQAAAGGALRLCGEPRHGALDLSYRARVAAEGTFGWPGASRGLGDAPSPSQRLEVTP